MNSLRLSTNDKVLMVVLFLLTLALRGLYVYFNQDLLSPGSVGSQRELAQSIVRDHAFKGTPPTAASGMTGATTAYWEPGYPLLLAPIEAVAGSRAVVGRVIVQAILAGLVTVVFYLLALAVFNSTAVAGLTGLLTSASYLGIVFSAIESDVTLTALLMGVWLLLVMRMADRPRLVTGLGAALAAGLLVHTRVATVPMVVMGTLWMMWRLRGRGAWAYGVGVWLVMIATLVPWAYRNYVVPFPHYPQDADLRPDYQQIKHERGHAVPIVSRLGFDLWMGNNDRASGGEIADHQQYNRDAHWQRHLDTRQYPEAFWYAQVLPEPKRDQWYGYLAAEWIRRHPAEWLQLRVKAFTYFWTTQNLWLPESQSRLRVTENLLMPVGLVLMLLTALAGMRWSHRWRHRTGLLTIALVCYPLYYVFGHASLWHHARAPLDGVLLVYCAFFLACFVPSASANLRAGIGRIDKIVVVDTDAP